MWLLALSLLGAARAEEPAPGPGAGVVVDRVAAVVNDEIVTLSEVYELGADYLAEAVAVGGEQARASAEVEVLERLIERRLVGQEMAALKLDVTDQDLEKAIDDVARSNGLDRETLRVEVEKSGLGWDQYRAELRENLREMKFEQAVLRPRVTVTEDELKDAYLRVAGDTPVAARVQAIFLAFPKDGDDAARASVRQRAEDLRVQAASGDFGALSRANDQGPFGAQGGEMGTFAPGELMETLDKALQATPTGQVSPVVETEMGVFLLKVAARESRGGADLEAMRERLSNQIFQVRMEDEKARWFQQARRRAAVRVLLPGAPATP